MKKEMNKAEEVTVPAEETTVPAEETTVPEKKQAVSKKKKETVRFKIPKGRSDQERGDVFVAVNGKSYLIKRGVEVDMPKEVYEVLRNSEEQMEYAQEIQENSKEQELVIGE